MPMILEVSINGTRQQDLLTVERAADGQFRARAEDLRLMRLKVDPALPPESMVWLNSLPGLTLRYDEPTQALLLQAPDNLLAPYVINLRAEPAQLALPTEKPIPATILNYGVYHTHQGSKNYLAGNAELLFTSWAGIFSTTGLYNNAVGAGRDKTVRLDSQWQYINPQTVRTYTLGDFISGSLSWSNSIRMAGFQWASDFEKRPDIVTTALPQFSGSAALPSTLDLFVNQQKIYSGALPSGPFDLLSLPYISGGDVTLLVTDAAGRQTSITQPYYYSASLLREGLTEFSLDVGTPRFNYGVKSMDYDNRPSAMASLRHGLTSNTSAEGHAEASSDGLANFGVGLAQGITGRGLLNASLSASQYRGYQGTRARLGLEGQIAGLRLYGSSERSFADYLDLARVSSLRLARRENIAGSDYAAWLSNSARSSASDRAGISFNPFEHTSVNLNYQRIQYPDERTQVVNLSLSQGISQRVSLYATAYTDLNHRDRRGAYLTLNISLDNNINAAISAQRNNNRTSYSQQISGTSGSRQGDFGWGLSNTFSRGADGLLSGHLSYNARQARLLAYVEQSGHSTRTRLEAEGAVLAAGGGLFMSNRIGDAYAIITNAGPDTEVIQGGVNMGRTDSGGRALLPRLPPYYAQQIFIDPTTLPDGWELAATERIAMAGYRQGAIVDFGAKVIHGAVLILHDKSGKPLPPGFIAQLENGEPGVTGYDGQLYLRGLGRHNRVVVDLGVNGSCSAYFDYDPNGQAQPLIGPLLCQ